MNKLNNDDKRNILEMACELIDALEDANEEFIELIGRCINQCDASDLLDKIDELEFEDWDK